MKFIYATDLHGDTYKYEAIYRYALQNNIKYIHIGADILPKGKDMLKLQKKFVKGYLKSFYEKCSNKDIKIFTMFGNDDLYSKKKYFKEYGKLLDEESETIEDFNFIGYPYVPDYPFSLVTSCKYDYDGWEPELYFGRKLDLGEKGLVEIPDKFTYFKNKGTIKEDLNSIRANHKTVIAIHCPPCSLGLDVCMDGRKVGSKSVYEWIEQEQPGLVLCGHIHESFYKTGVWKAMIGSSVVLQPGQYGEGTYIVVIDLDKGTYENKVL